MRFTLVDNPLRVVASDKKLFSVRTRIVILTYLDADFVSPKRIKRKRSVSEVRRFLG
jgi:hypothetical protein